MNINTLLSEALTPEMAKVVQEGIVAAVEAQVNEALLEAKDAAVAQALVVQKQAEELKSAQEQYDEEMKAAAKKIVELEKFYNTETNKAVDVIMKLTEEKQTLEEHYVDQLQEAVSYIQEQTDVEKVKSLQETIANYVIEIAELKEHAQSFGEHVRTETLAEMESLVKEATQEFITEHQEKFTALDQLARFESTLNTIKESFEKSGLVISEDLAFQGLQEQVVSKESEINSLQEALKAKEAEIFEYEKAAKFAELTESFSDLQKSKLRKLSESISAKDIAEFDRTLGYIIEATMETKATIVEKNDTKESEVIVEAKQEKIQSKANDKSTNADIKTLVSQMI